MEVNRHPLTVDVVVQEILRHVSPSMEDLLAFRQVCRLWRELATPVISSRNLELPLITFKGEWAEGNVEDSGTDCKGCNPEYSLLPKYIEYLETDADQKIIFSVFHIKAISLDHPIVQRFLQEFGHTIKKLRLNEGLSVDYSTPQAHFRKCDRVGNFKPETFRRLLLSCPNLEEIVLGHVHPEGGENGFLLPDDKFQTKIKRMAYVQGKQPQEKFISDLLKVCPSLERFINEEVSLDGKFPRALSQSPHLSSLKELAFSQEEFETFLEDKSERELQLRKLRFYQLGVGEESVEFCRFLDTQKSSLEILIVDEWGVEQEDVEMNVPPLPRISFPDVMKKLEVLKINGIFPQPDEDEEPDTVFGQLLLEPLDFRGQFPLLKTLMLGGEAAKYDLNAFFAPGMQPQLVLEGLELPRGIGVEDLRHIAELFPNVKHLTLRGVGDDTILLLFTQWSQLESLLLDLDDVNIETALTGLSSEQIPLVQSLIENGEEINIQADNPSIVNFQNLKELRIYERNKNEIVQDLPRTYLTDVSIHYSFCKLPKFEFLGVNLHKFTIEGINQLCSGSGLKWNKKGKWPMQCQKDLESEYKLRPNCNEEFSTY